MDVLTTLPSGKQLYVEEHDPSGSIASKKPTIIFIHGLTGSARTYRSIVPAFPDRTRIAFDLEGHARSPMSNQIPTIFSLAQDVEDILESLGLKEKRVDVVAHSAGTIIALQFALMYPQHIRKLVLMGSAAQPITEDVRVVVKGRGEMLREKGLGDIVPFMLSVGLGERAKADPEIVKMVKEEMLDQDSEGVARIVDAVADFRWEKNEEEWSVDTVVITGEEDKVSDIQAGEQVAKATKAKFWTMPAVGHLLTYEDPESVAILLNAAL